jgi:hypothetical protein
VPQEIVKALPDIPTHFEELVKERQLIDNSEPEEIKVKTRIIVKSKSTKPTVKI